MNEKLTEVVFILDRSGSMKGLESDTIGGFNSMLDEQRKVEGDVLISTILFDDRIETLHDRVDLKKIANLTSNDYTVRGCTALLDALGKTIKHISKVQKEMPEDLRPAKTMFIITTDGLENSSREFDFDKVKKLVEKKQIKKNWEFIFLGANMDAINTATNIGIRADRATNFHSDSKGTRVNYRSMSRAVTSFRCATPMEAGTALKNWDEEIVTDFKSRRRK